MYSIKYDKYYCKKCNSWDKSDWYSGCTKYPHMYDYD